MCHWAILKLDSNYLMDPSLAVQGVVLAVRTARSRRGHPAQRCHYGQTIEPMKPISMFAPDPTVTHCKEFAWWPKRSRNGTLIIGSHWRVETAYYIPPNGKRVVVDEYLYTEYEYFWAKLSNDLPEPTKTLYGRK